MDTPQYKFEFTNVARSQLKELQRHHSERILKKLNFLQNSSNPLRFAESLTNFDFGTFRFRIGVYRVICDVKKRGIITIIAVKHRNKVYG